jgi:hypothetical protein
MAISQRARLARAWQDTDFRHPKRILFEGVLVAAATWGVFQYARMPHEAVAHVTAIVVSIVVGALAIPVCEFVWNYARAPLAIENDQLRARLSTVRIAAPPAVALPDDPTPTVSAVSSALPSPSTPTASPGARSYVRETSGEAIIARYKSLGWKEREAVFETTYRDHWIQGRGVIATLRLHADGTVAIALGDRPKALAWGFATMEKSERYRVDHLEVGDTVDFEASITGYSAGSLDLDGVSVTRVT